ncbi:hypothetical protein [Pseudochrobactrum asaccharolyticum]|jgi:hypothetical protein|uniref:Uncharacterized protein n=1 Tax=Pseudochrobactrum asaccharolyticum TaxID=354351 RepID=A0A366DSN1_9HYPH|nr:hypothetical protein [Pseudochrobactrum asaccharolyticum]MBX8801724.1 hypothetical protein [Ochrobactrum sp. MR28]MBX8816767.1 hypothetical protein [Ochrobactrum sp. MR31]MCF7673015.1 DUF148 domain-containing protein [Bacillus subtilis]MDR2309608.1 DUF148 domain-containing protein [Brucellaceae bacterium]MCF7646268.1 DUF148 domain-containing protein [Pseudochrobactrum asaccharolyticum]
MTSSTKAQLDDILKNTSQTRQDKIDALMKLQEDARDIQRAATEGGMDPDDGLNKDLREIELALEKLGASSDDTGAATL